MRINPEHSSGIKGQRGSWGQGFFPTPSKRAPSLHFNRHYDL